MKRLIVIFPIAVFLLVTSFASWGCPKGLKYNTKLDCVDSNGKVIAGTHTNGYLGPDGVPIYDINLTTKRWASHFKYERTFYTASTTAPSGIAKNMVVDKKKKRNKKSKGSLKLNLVPHPCGINLHAEDCNGGARRTQIYTNHSYPEKKDLVFGFSLYKPSQGVSAKTNWTTGPLFFELKADHMKTGVNIAPTFRLHLNPKTKKIGYVLDVCDSNTGKTCDKYGDIASLKFNKWTDFKIETKQTTGKNGYVRVYINRKLVYSHKGKSSSTKLPVLLNLGPYVCASGCDKMAKNEPNHTFYFDLVSSEIVTGLEVTSPNGKEKWKTKKKYTIKWKKGKAGTYVKIQLFKKGRFYRTIAAKTKNDGKHAWKVPSTLVNSAAYKIKITSTKNRKLTDSSNNNFTITK